MSRTSPRTLTAASALVLSLFFVSPQAADAADLCGKWKGVWHGCTDGLEGTCNARITKTGPNCYKAVFSGRAFKVMPYVYTMHFKACYNAQTGKYHFRMKKKLPIWDWYWVRGSSDGCTFFARYNTDDHVGYFKMTKVR